MMKHMRAAIIAVAFLAVAPLALMAQEVVVPETVVTFNWGDLIGVFFTNLASNPDSAAWTAFGLALTWLVTRLAPPLQWAFKVFQVEQLLKNAIMNAINSTKGAAEGQALSADVGNVVLAKAIQYAIDNGQAWLINWMGGPKGTGEKVIARLNLKPGVSVVDVGPAKSLTE